MIQLALPGGYMGTLDELVQAVERGSVDVAQLPLAEIGAQVLRAGRERPADMTVLADAAALVARLIQLKSLTLLPKPLPPAATGEPEEPHTEELARLMEEYRLFKAAADGFREREQDGLRSFPRLAPPPTLPPSSGLGNVTLDRLLKAVTEALARQPQEPAEVIPRVAVTVRERLAALERELKDAGSINFSRYIRSCHSRIEVIVGFMAVLELIKEGRAHAEQPEPFGDIVIVAGEPVHDSPS